MRKSWLGFAAVALLASVAIADDQINGLGDTYWSVRLQVATTTQCVPRYPGQTICALFPAGNADAFSNRISMIYTRDTAASCVFAGYVGRSEDGTNGIDLDADTKNVDDNALTTCGASGAAACAPFGDGAGSVVRVELPGIPVQQRKRWDDLKAARAKGFRPGLCSVAVTGDAASGEEKIFAPCNRDSDCANYGAGVCYYEGGPAPMFGRDPFSERLPYAGMFWLCECTTGTCNLDIEKQVVPR